jgi:hypothetical protein
MSQTTSLIAYANDIDNGNVLFNLSAWMGGWAGQNDSASVSIYFQNSASQIIGNRTTMGPVLDTNRGGITETIFRQKNGSVPVNTRWVTISVNMTKYYGADDDGSIDNICFELNHI